MNHSKNRTFLRLPAWIPTTLILLMRKLKPIGQQREKVG